MLTKSRVKFRSPQNISVASQTDDIAVGYDSATYLEMSKNIIWGKLNLWKP